jgi:gliding motility-associated-like protein
LVLDYEDKSGATLYGYCSGGTGSTNSALDNNISIGNGQGQSHGGSCATTLSGWAAETSQPFLVTTGSTTISLKEYGGDCDNSDGWFDDVRIRKYTSNPPTVAIDTTPLLYLNDLAAGQYVITMTGSTGTFKDTFVVTQPTAVIAMPDSVNINCHDSATGVAWVVTPIGGTPGYTFLWSTAQTTDTISVLAPGVYRVTVTDSYGCRDSAAVNIIQPSTSLSLTPDSENVKCFGQTTGLAWAIVSGGTPGYSYLWSGSGQTTDTAINLGQGSYTVTVSDAQHCSAVATVDIAQPSSAPGVTFSTVNIVCKGVNNGKIVATASGGTSGYTYLWSTAQTTDSLTDQGAGSYTISVTDANGCTVSGTTAILPSGDSIAIDTATSPATCGSANGSITVSVSGGSGVYQYAWSNDSTGASISSLAGDTVYKVTVTDAAGCRDSIAVFLHQSAALIATVSTQNDSCNEQAGSASISINSGDPPYTYQWTPAGTDTARLDSGTYSVLITDAAGCSVTKTFTITNIDNNCQSLVLFPTAFTPNGDGKNDQFYAVYSPDLDKLQMRIYDRWGQLVFEASNDTQQWDGTYKGAPQPIGVYIWFAEYNFTNKPTQAVTGNVTLIR